MHREPDVGFDLGSPGSHPGPKAGAKPLHHPGIPITTYIDLKMCLGIYVSSLSIVLFFFQVSSIPNMGLKLTTLRSRDICSMD